MMLGTTNNSLLSTSHLLGTTGTNFNHTKSILNTTSSSLASVSYLLGSVVTDRFSTKNY